MNFKKRSKKRILCLLTGIMMVATLIMPVSASAATTTWTAPSEPMTVDDDIVKVAAHAAATSAVHYLGGNLVTERATDYKAITGAGSAAEKLQAGMERLELGIYGTSINENPDPYMWNYLYNLYADVNGGTKSSDAVYLSGIGSPMNADTIIVDELGTSYSLDRRPEVLYGIGKNDGVTYEDLISDLPENKDESSKNDYDPIQVPYSVTNLYSMISAMYDLSDGIIASGKDGRYGDTNAIAQKYEKYIKGLQLYVLEKIESGEIEKKTVAIVSANTVGEGEAIKFKAFTSNDSSGTAASCRAAEYLENTTTNILDVVEAEESNGSKYLTAAQVNEADYIITGNVVESSQATEEDVAQKLINAGIDKDKIKPIYATAPEGIFSIFANSVENIFGIPALQGFVYPEYIDPITCSMYLYENFWHVSDKSTLEALVTTNFENASLAEGIEIKPESYDSSEVEAIIDEGIEYYNAYNTTFAGKKLEVSERATANTNTIDLSSEENESKVEVGSIADKTYTGSTINPSVKVTYDGDQLSASTDYRVKYENNVNVGEATAVITFRGKYSGTIRTTFNIKPKNIKQATIASVKNPTYTGSTALPSLTIKNGESTLTAGTDYTVSGTAVNAGEATATITGEGNYTGETEVSYTIAKAPISKVTASIATQVTYTGKALKPAATVKNGSTALKSGTDYTITYKSNTNPGKATATITGKGNYTGTKTVTFYISPKKETISKLSSTKAGQLKVTWKKDTKATGYQIVVAKNSKFTSGKKVVTVKSYKTVSKTITKLTKGKKYYVKVRAYKTVSGKNIYGPYSTVKTKTVKK